MQADRQTLCLHKSEILVVPFPIDLVVPKGFKMVTALRFDRPLVPTMHLKGNSTLNTCIP